MNRAQNTLLSLNGKVEAEHAPLVIAENRSRAIANPTKLDVEELVAAAQLRVEQTMAQIEKIAGRAGMEAEIINDVIFQEDPSGMRLVTIKRQVRIQKDPL